MAERTVRVQFYNWVDEEGVTNFARLGEKVDISDEEAERGDSLGSFEESPPVVTSDPMAAAFGQPVESDRESGVPHAQPPQVSEEAAQFPEPEDTDGEPDLPDPVGEGYPELADTGDDGEAPKQQPETNVTRAQEQRQAQESGTTGNATTTTTTTTTESGQASQKSRAKKSDD
jgi:hypothetical protein